MSDRNRGTRVFWRAAGASLAVLLPLGYLALDAVRRALGSHWSDICLSLPYILIPPLALAALIGRCVCRRMRVPLPGRASETLVRGVTPQRPGGRARFKETSPAFLTSVVAWHILMASIRLFTSSAVGKPWREPLLGLSFFAMLAWLIFTIDCFITVDAGEHGIVRRSPFGRKGRPVAWSEIASCTLETVRHPLPALRGTTCVFRDRAGNELLRVKVDHAAKGDGVRFLEMVREHQGMRTAPAELMASDIPEGTGIEPEAASVPVGTGTEMEAAAAPDALPGAQAGARTGGRERAR